MGRYTIPEAPGLVRDAHSKALLSVDRRGLQANIAARASATRIAHLTDEINTLKNDMTEIKDLLRSILNGSTPSS